MSRSPVTVGEGRSQRRGTRALLALAVVLAVVHFPDVTHDLLLTAVDA